MHPTLVKQALLSLLDVGIQQAAGGSLELAAEQEGASIRVAIAARPRTGPLVACLVIFLALGGMVHFVSGRGHEVPPLALNEDLLPREVGGFTYAGQTLRAGSCSSTRVRAAPPCWSPPAPASSAI